MQTSHILVVLAAALAFAATTADAAVKDTKPGNASGRCFETIAKNPKTAIDEAHSLYQAGDTITARRCLGDALVASGDADRGARILDDLARELSKASDVSPQIQGAVWGEAGRAWLAADDLDHAKTAFDAAIKRLPGDLQLRIDRAVALGGSRHYWEAIDDLNAAIDGGVKTAEVYLLRATAWRELGTADLARDDIDRAAKIDPTNAGVLLERGRIRKLSKDTAGAEKDFLAVLKLAPGSGASLAARHELQELAARKPR
jgi:tetratricopeptide (TPR) repeat protein